MVNITSPKKIKQLPKIIPIIPKPANAELPGFEKAIATLEASSLVIRTLGSDMPNSEYVKLY